MADGKFDTYLDLIYLHLYSDSPEDFAVIPIRVSAVPKTIDGQTFFFGRQTITGDFEAFRVARGQQPGDVVLLPAWTFSGLL